jgi:ADP-ribosylglycohydrolase
MNEKEDKIRAGLWGLIVADAMGVPHEFKRTHQIPQKLQMVMPKEYQKTYRDVPYGTWSDDTSLALALADSLATCRDVDLDDFANRMLKWYEDNEYTPDGVRFDIGTTTRKAFHKLAKHVSPRESGEKGEESQANGSLMRTLPLALWHTGHDRELYLDACEVSAVTHAHPIVQAACGVYCVAARYVLMGDDPKRSFRTAMERMKVTFQLPSVRGTGFVLDSLAYAVRALESMPSYELAVVEAIRLGNDTDTTACIAGGIVAVRDGMRGIPRDWMDALQGRAYAEEIIERFIQNRAKIT